MPPPGTEHANHQLFISELCTLLDVPRPDPGREDTRDNAYVFERRVQFLYGDGSASLGFIDCYRRGQFVLEAKRLRAPGHTKGFDDAMLRVRGQAEAYVRALPTAEGRPPFLLVGDVDHVIELYVEFSRSGATYPPFPDPRSHRIALPDLHDERIRTRLRTLGRDAAALDPARISAKVTRAVAGELALLATSLDADGLPSRSYLVDAARRHRAEVGACDAGQRRRGPAAFCTGSTDDATTAERIEEERRLMYVGITRARSSLAVSTLMRRKRGRATVLGMPSRSIKEMKLHEVTVK